MLPRKTHLPQPDAGDSVTSLSARIRRARALAAISQAELAKRVGVQRSAVTQWECTAGTTPSVGHLIQIACETAVCFEWLATGRGPSRAQEGLLDAAVQKRRLRARRAGKQRLGRFTARISAQTCCHRADHRTVDGLSRAVRRPRCNTRSMGGAAAPGHGSAVRTGGHVTDQVPRQIRMPSSSASIARSARKCST
nr:helix-turn-helix transcriptional regulator [Xanthomonas citri]